MLLSLLGGQLSREALRSLPGSTQGLVKKYIDKSGKRRHVGVPSRLKRSQYLLATKLYTLHVGNRIQLCRFLNPRLYRCSGPTLLSLETASLHWPWRPERWDSVFASCFNGVSKNWLSFHSWEVPLPGPRMEVNIDWTCSDAELFARVFSPLGNVTIECLGDLWHDVAWH